MTDYMDPADVATLLGVAASFDNRNANEEAVVAWRVALGDIAFRDARDAIAAHYAESREWIMPADIRHRVKRVRAKRIEKHPPIYPPPGLDEAQERAWLAEARRRVGDGEQVDSAAAYGELVTGQIPRVLMPTPASEEPNPPRPTGSVPGEVIEGDA